MRLYIAGPMTGLPKYNLPAFDAAARELEAAGYDVVNPGRHGVDPEFTWTDYMRRGLTELLTCDGVALLPGAHNSNGARIERRVAEDLGMLVLPLWEWL